MALTAGLAFLPASAFASRQIKAPSAQNAGIKSGPVGSPQLRGIATLGPASWDINTIVDLAHSGIFIFRVNYSHGTAESNAEIVSRVREASRRIKRPLAVLGDLQGPKIRLGKIKGGGVTLSAGEPFTLTSETDLLGNQSRASLDYPPLIKAAQPGDFIVIGDGDAKLRVLAVEEGLLETIVVEGGLLRDRKGVTLLDRDIPIHTLMPKDRKDLKAMLEAGVDGVMLSMVRSAGPVREARSIAAELGRPKLPVWTKIENQAGLDNIDEISQASDVMVVAQGDLGVAMGSRLAAARALILKAGRRWATATAVATHLLKSSLKETGPPTVKEIALIRRSMKAGAVYFMLTDETSVGPRPVEASRLLREVIDTILSSQEQETSRGNPVTPKPSGLRPSDALPRQARLEEVLPPPQLPRVSPLKDSWLKRKTRSTARFLLLQTEILERDLKRLKDEPARPRKSLFKTVTLGVLLITLGTLLVPLPIPGSPILFAGLFILAARFPWARRLLTAVLVPVRRFLLWLNNRVNPKDAES